ncbi:hypothetical protein BH10ACI4_BH10ACI4_35020 [soil metagenome]
MRHARLAVLLGLVCGSAFASNPRWVTGPPYFTSSGQPVVWYTDAPQYYTDPGDLSASVNHAAADAMVAVAAGVWNIATSRLTLLQGGTLDEHVSGANVFFGSGGLVLPLDVRAANSAAKQIAVIYDRDGSVTDLLLGVGASDPSGCRQSGVTESVDSISADGFIRHAVLVVNGRCTGTAKEMQLQLQYQLMRAFGRVLGMGWSQTNDNVFTGTPTPTVQQALHWPIMHPIDIICGPYTYQCLPQPFTLRDDDIAGMAELYYIPQGQAGVGKIDSILNANRIAGRIYFPTGQPMQGVNVVGRRLEQFRSDTDVESWQTISSVSGARFRRISTNPVAGQDSDMSASMGTPGDFYEGWYLFSRVPMLPGFWQWIVVETEPVNPLYVGAYSVGPYTQNTVQPSGDSTTYKAGIMGSYSDYEWFDFTVNGAAAVCTRPGGSEATPQQVDVSGWWAGQLCGYGQTAWSGLTVKANRSLTVEVTAKDELGSATANKSMPVIGVWRSGDALGSAPALAAKDALNGVAAGMTSLTVSGMAGGALRMAIVDRRGDGRPDFHFGGRVLYSDSVSPANVAASGGVVTISWMGFRAGNTVAVNGVAATVQSWTSTSIMATVPSSRSFASGARSAVTANIVVRDLATGGATTMSGALQYAAPLPEGMTVVSAPSGTAFVGVATGTAFAVRILQADGVTPVVGEPVTFSATAGTASFSACAAASCTVLTDVTGVASTTVTPLSAGAIGLLAVGDTTRAAAGFTAVAPVRTATVSRAVEYVAAGATFVWSPQVTFTDNSASVAGLPVVWAGSAGVWVGASSSLMDGNGVASVPVTLGPLQAGVRAVGSACGWGGTVCAAFAAEGVAAEKLQVEIVSGAGQALRVDGTFAAVTVRVTDGLGHPVAGAAVEFHQTVVSGVVCAGQGRCPAQAVLSLENSQAISDADGLASVRPLQLAGQEVTNLVATAGTQGFGSWALTKGW